MTDPGSDPTPILGDADPAPPTFPKFGEKQEKLPRRHLGEFQAGWRKPGATWICPCPWNELESLFQPKSWDSTRKMGNREVKSVSVDLPGYSCGKALEGVPNSQENAGMLEWLERDSTPWECLDSSRKTGVRPKLEKPRGIKGEKTGKKAGMLSTFHRKKTQGEIPFSCSLLALGEQRDPGIAGSGQANPGNSG